MLMYFSTAEWIQRDKELTAVAVVLLSLHGCGRQGVSECVIMSIPYSICACACVCVQHIHTLFLGGVCVCLYLSLTVYTCVSKGRG